MSHFTTRTSWWAVGVNMRQAYFIAFIIAVASLSCSPQGPGAGAPDVQSNNIRSYLITAAREITESPFPGVSSLADWEKKRPERYAEYIEMISLQDMPLNGERPPLNTHVTGTIQRDGYRVEKLFYESLPGLYVPANLYIPDHIKGPAPAVLYVCGHAQTQKVYYQAHPAKFARLGFVCLIVETVQLGEVRGEHHGCWARGWFNWYSRGYTPSGVEVWNAIRGLDLLAERPEVDSGKMGVTGISGGGAQTWFIAAADPRIKAAAPVCGACTLEAEIATRTIDGHCDCMMPINTFRVDFKNIGALISPRPLLIGQADRDGIFKIEAVRQVYYDLKKIYALHGAPENIQYVESPGGHSYHRISRERVFSFFLEHLMGKKVAPKEAGDIDSSPESLLSEEKLRVYADGPPPDDRTTTIQDSFVRLAGNPDIRDEAGLSAYRDSVKKSLMKKTFGAFPGVPPPLAPIRDFRTLDRAERGSDIYSFVSERGWRLKVDIRWKNNPSRKTPLMIVLRNPDENRGDSEGFIGGLGPGWNLAFFEARGVGEFGWDPNQQWHIRRASAWTGRTIASMQVLDVLRCIEFCRTLDGVDPVKIGIAARDDMAVAAMYAALLDGKCKTLILKNPPASQDEASRPDGRGPSLEMLNCLRITDLCQLPALLAPAGITFIGEIPESYKWSEELLIKLGKSPFSRAEIGGMIPVDPVPGGRGSE